MKQVILYGLAGAENMYRALAYYCVFDTEASTTDIKNIAMDIQDTNPSIEHVWMITNRYGLKRDFILSNRKPSIETCAVFKDILEREGIKVI